MDLVLLRISHAWGKRVTDYLGPEVDDLLPKDGDMNLYSSPRTKFVSTCSKALAKLTIGSGKVARMVAAREINIGKSARNYVTGRCLASLNEAEFIPQSLARKTLTWKL
nr:DNA-directed RNA polymerase V subunit 1 [Ipomoea batatas]